MLLLIIYHVGWNESCVHALSFFINHQLQATPVFYIKISRFSYAFCVFDYFFYLSWSLFCHRISSMANAWSTVINVSPQLTFLCILTLYIDQAVRRDNWKLAAITHGSWGNIILPLTILVAWRKWCFDERT